MEEPLKVEIIAFAPTAFYHCQHCELVWNQIGFSRGVRQEQLQNGLPEDMQREYAAVSEWVRQLFGRYGDRIVVQVVDAASVEGVWKSLRYGIHRYPAVIVDGRWRSIGMDLNPADAFIAQRLALTPSS